MFVLSGIIVLVIILAWLPPLVCEQASSMQVLRKSDGGSRGFGFVTYKDEISVEKCLVMQHQLGGRTVELKRAIKKEEMPAGGYGPSGGAAVGGYGGNSGQTTTPFLPWSKGISQSSSTRTAHCPAIESCCKNQFHDLSSPDFTTACGRLQAMKHSQGSLPGSGTAMSCQVTAGL